MTLRRPLRVLFFLGSFMMLFGVIAAGLTYRDMRTQRLLHEPVRLFKLNPARPSSWQSASLPVYQNGAHRVVLAVSAPWGTSPADNSGSASGIFFHGAIEVVIENPEGKAALNVKPSSLHEGSVKPDRLLWFTVDTLIVENISQQISSGDWKIQTRISAGDSQFAGSLAELVVIPPHPEQFSQYLEQASHKLYGAGIFLVSGFFFLVFGGRTSSKRI